MIIKKTGLVTGLVICVLTGASVGASASARPQDFSNGMVCNTSFGETNCMSANGTNGDLVYGKSYDQDNEELANSSPEYVCNGTSYVTNLCPFTPGSHLNSDFHGKEIVSLSNANSGLLYRGVYSDHEVYQGTASDTGILWVQEGSPSAGTAEWVNVQVSDQDVAQDLVCQNGTNQPLIVVDTSSAGPDSGLNCSWSG